MTQTDRLNDRRQQVTSSQSNLADMTVKITSVINRHLAEDNCIHNIQEIAKEIFDN